MSGAGFTTDTVLRFADLRSVVRDPLHDAPTDEWTARPSALITDYRPANLVVPYGGTERAERLRTTLRDAYRACGTAFDPDGTRYAAHELYARIRRLGAFGYRAGAARESDPDAVAERARAAVRELVAAVS